MESGLSATRLTAGNVIVSNSSSGVLTEDELAPYDYHRKPRPVEAVRGKKLLIEVESLRGDFACPICLSIMNNTAMTLECSHRFCKKCIEQSIRMSGNDCPTCRVKVTTRRSLREDSRFNKMIQAIFGDTEQFERRDERAKSNADDILIRFAQQRSLISAQAPAPVERAKTDEVSQTVPATTSPNSKPKKKRPAPVGMTNEDLLFVLRKHPMERLPAATGKEYIKANHALTVSHMSQFVSQRYRSQQHSQTRSIGPDAIQIVYHDTGGEEHVLDDEDSLSDLVAKFKKGDRAADLVLHYKIVENR